MPPSTPSIWWHDSNEIASGKTRTLQVDEVAALVFPFDKFWIVTNFRGFILSAYVDHPSEGEPEFGQLRYDWFWSKLPGHTNPVQQTTLHWGAQYVTHCALEALHLNTTNEVNSPVQTNINRGRSKTIGKLTYIPALPSFIQVSGQLKARSEPKGGTHASPTAHDRRGHWRTYKATGKRVWIKDSAVLGGSQVPRSYRVGCPPLAAIVKPGTA